ncbi:hypothetical protein PAHAL_8G267600 [Panicum hallii]|uniref:Uncharacterized protein n=1 Tax=Panicum hallii TaxID=206008 RepID=A0A2T8IAF4_9POAL|nr:hypothetical protein PAHAL_8G267600 [Panicum hallii]
MGHERPTPPPFSPPAHDETSQTKSTSGTQAATPNRLESKLLSPSAPPPNLTAASPQTLAAIRSKATRRRLRLRPPRAHLRCAAAPRRSPTLTPPPWSWGKNAATPGLALAAVCRLNRPWEEFFSLGLHITSDIAAFWLWARDFF